MSRVSKSVFLACNQACALAYAADCMERGRLFKGDTHVCISDGIIRGGLREIADRLEA